MFGHVGREAPDARCSLCARKKSEVHHLVKGTIGSVCSDCVAKCVQLLEGKMGDPGVPFRAGLNTKIMLIPSDTAPKPKVCVEIDADVAAVFGDERSVNAALRPLAALISAKVASEAATKNPEP